MSVSVFGGFPRETRIMRVGSVMRVWGSYYIAGPVNAGVYDRNCAIARSAVFLLFQPAM